MTNSNSLLQTSTPDRLRGRVMSVYTFVFGGVSPFGAFYTGLLAEHFGPAFTVLVSAIIVGLGGISVFLTGWHRLPAVVPSNIPIPEEQQP
jgi:MFS family permease